MVVFPNAKINIGLHIVKKRPDNYHNIESVFYPICLSDILEVIKNNKYPGSDIRFSSSGIPVPGNPDDNLCVRIYKTMLRDYSLPAVKVHLHKIIPIGAGLGGGSSDAAFFIKAINELFGLKLTEERMLYYAGLAGSDCPFFIHNKPAFVEGRGEILSPMDIDLKGYYMVLLNPGIHISTAEAYSGIVPARPKESLGEMISHLRPAGWKERVKNNFEEVVFRKYPVLKTLKGQLYLSGAVYASMSGSGSSIYGIFDKKPGLMPELENHLVSVCKIG